MPQYSYTNKRKLVKSPEIVMRDRKEEVGAGSTSPAYLFPLDLGTHMFVMNFSKYHFAGDAINARLVSKSIALPVPQSIVDRQNIGYNEIEFGWTQGQVLKAIGEIQNIYRANGGGFDTQVNVGQFVQDALGTAKDAFDNTDAKRVGGALIRSATEGLSGALGVDNPGALADTAFGQVLNPHVALLFENVNLKKFSFSWRLSPATKEESTALANIITILKRNVLPKYGGAGHDGAGISYLEYPHVVDCFFAGTALEHLFYFKRAAINAINVDYSPEGLSFFAETGGPTTVDLTLDFIETEIHTSDDYMGQGLEDA